LSINGKFELILLHWICFFSL